MVGLVFPALSGAPVLFAGLVVAAWAEGFEHVSTGALIVLGVMALLTYQVAYLAGTFGAKRIRGTGTLCFLNHGEEVWKIYNQASGNQS